MASDVLVDLVKQCLSKLADCGADVRLVTCDQAASNQTCIWTIFGATKEIPYFEFESRKYFCMFDFPHLIKRLLGQLRKHQYLYDEGGNIIDNYKDYERAWLYDKQSSSNLLGHITDVHMAPNN